MDPCGHLQLLPIYVVAILSLSTAYPVTMPINNNVLMVGSKVDFTYIGNVASGLQRAVDECQHQFRWDRWNCPSSELYLHQTDQKRAGNREMAFVHAVNAAGVMYTLARNCSSSSGQNLDHCSCGELLQNAEMVGADSWMWRGCRDQFEFGERLSRLYVDSMAPGQDTRAAVQRHNYDAGRRAVYKTLQERCKCHGVSGSCATKTCWQALPHFRQVGDYLHKRYKRAHKVQVDNAPGSPSEVLLGNTRPVMQSLKRTDLAYLEDSPDYCWLNKTEGIHRTLGRECSRPSDGNDSQTSREERRSCRNLCTSCGLTVQKTVKQTVKQCNCRFKWCCEVKCDECVEETDVYTCALPQ